MKVLTIKKIWLFSIGQLGWALLSGIVVNWLVYFYQPDISTINAGQTIFIPQGTVVLGAATIIGAIIALGRIFDAFTDPFIASKSDGCQSKYGRRIPFLKWSSIPFALSTFLIFITPVDHSSWINAAYLLVIILIYYVSITAYCTPYTALIPELGQSQKQRMTISTAISFTFILGTAIAYMAPSIWQLFEPNFGRVNAMRITFGLLSTIAFICLLIPVFTISEKDYIKATPSSENALKSLISTFKNRDFRIFTASDIFYWLGLTIFQTGLPFFVTSLLKLDESMTGIYFITMTGCSLLFYIPINHLAERFGKKNVLLLAFVIFSFAFGYTSILGSNLPIPPLVQGFILCLLAAFPMATFGILPTAIVADIALSDATTSGNNREGMFYAARTFAFKLGQSISLLIFTSIATTNLSDGGGYRIAALLSVSFCLIGGSIFIFYNERKVKTIIIESESLT